MKKILIISLLLLFSCQNESSSESVITNNESTKKILAIWDSLTAWYNLSLEKSYPLQLEKLLNNKEYGYEVINAWVSWDTSKQVLDRLDIYLDEDEWIPEIAILVAWANDWLRWSSLVELEKNLNLIIDKLEEKNIKVILWWMQVPPNLWLFYTNNFKKLYSKIAKKRDLHLIDFFLEWVAWDRSLNLDDWIHPNEEWYSIISNNVLEFLIENNLVKKW